MTVAQPPYDAEPERAALAVATLAEPCDPAQILATRALTLGFGPRTVLADVNLTFPRGTITALIGPTGSGKSTFLRTLNRMNEHLPAHHHSGDVTLDGHSIFHPQVALMALRRRVGMVFQRPNPFPLSILENVVAGVRAHKMADKPGRRVIAESRLREVGLWDAVSGRLNESPFRLSGGQQQLLCLARALAIGPDVLLLDEPTSSLDPVTMEAVEELMRQLVPALTLVVVTHNLAQARRLAHYTAFFNQGRLVEHARTTQIFENPRSTETARYVTGRMG